MRETGLFVVAPAIGKQSLNGSGYRSSHRDSIYLIRVAHGKIKMIKIRLAYLHIL
jgi:hypothetical protein